MAVGETANLPTIAQFVMIALGFSSTCLLSLLVWIFNRALKSFDGLSSIVRQMESKQTDIVATISAMQQNITTLFNRTKENGDDIKHIEERELAYGRRAR